MRDQFRRKVLEVLFDGRPEADALVATRAKSFFEQIAAERKLLTVPADPAEAGKLAGRYHNDALGEIVVNREGGAGAGRQCSTSESGGARWGRGRIPMGRCRS